jgi:uncharacterized membrane protein YhaH (DUF805 family)
MERSGGISPEAAAAAGLMGLLFLVIGLAVTVFVIILWWRIFSRAGYSGALSLLILIPGVGALIMLLILAFGEWPVRRELDHLREWHDRQPPQ